MIQGPRASGFFITDNSCKKPLEIYLGPTKPNGFTRYFQQAVKVIAKAQTVLAVARDDPAIPPPTGLQAFYPAYNAFAVSLGIEDKSVK